jgi:glucokinase
MRMAREAIDSGKAPELAKAASDPNFSAKAVYNLAMQGDAAAQRIFQRFGEVLGILLAGLVNILDLDVYVLGGGVVSAWDAFAPTMFAELRERSLIYAASAPDDPSATKVGAAAQMPSYSPKKTVIIQASLGSDAGLYGAARIPAS